MTGELTSVHLVRHGEVDNPTGELYGRKPGFHLTPLGTRMAQKVADFFDGRDLRLVVSSPLERAQETAAPTAERHHLPIILDDDLIEAGNKFEGVNVNKNRMILAHPRYWPWYSNPAEPSWGEPYAQIRRRMSDVVRRALWIAEGGEAVLVSHQLPIWTMRRFLDGRPLAHDPRKRECALCSVTSLNFVGHQLVSVGYEEPAAELLAQARDVTPGSSAAEVHIGH